MSQSNPSLPWFYRLECPVRDYAWGNTADDGIIAGLLRADGREVPAGPRAELWMGAHPSAPSLLLPEKTPLHEAVAANPAHFLGQALADRGQTNLPFLFKVLDAGQALSIQAHPDKELAEKLHARDPEHYPDDNHKPELAVSLGDMDALVGFRRVKEIAGFIALHPEIAALTEPQTEERVKLEFPDEDAGDETHKAWIKERYGRLMRANPAHIQEAAESLLKRLGNTTPGSAVDLFRRLTELYGKDDPGLFCPFFLNLVKLNHGQGVFLGPNEPHAYLGGPILECMAASDNVVRAGLTKKFVDIDTLIDMLYYKSGPADIQSLEEDPAMSTYRVPVQEFTVGKLTPGIFNLVDAGRPSIWIVLEGSLRLTNRTGAAGSIESAEIRKGGVVLLPGDLSDRDIEVTASCDGDSVVYRATVGEEY